MKIALLLVGALVSTTALAQDVSVDLLTAAALCRPHVSPTTQAAQPGWGSCVSVLQSLRDAELAVIAKQSPPDARKQAADLATVEAMAIKIKEKK